MRNIWHFIREALSNSKKNFSTTLGAIVTIFLSLLIIGVFMVFSLIIEKLIVQVESDINITIFLADDVNAEDLAAFQDYIRTLPGVDKDGVLYVSKEDALEKFREQAGSEIVDALDGNPLPASIEIKLSDPEQVQAVVDEIILYPGTMTVIDRPDNQSESFRYGEEYVERLIDIANIIRTISLALIVLLVVVALIFINNTIRLAILARRKEIAIMRLVGASNGFIRGPYLMEGALQAAIGAGLAIGTISFACGYLLPKIQESTIRWLPLDFTSLDLGLIYLILLGVGLIIGLFGSFFSVRRHLKV
ncbi:MAG: permease-like cell division protein FtsX [Coriobacteriales bacterium]|nr:permease-like cell division protein FtsX [Coriobacteriales bacterium]